MSTSRGRLSRAQPKLLMQQDYRCTPSITCAGFVSPRSRSATRDAMVIPCRTPHAPNGRNPAYRMPLDGRKGPTHSDRILISVDFSRFTTVLGIGDRQRLA